MEISLLGGIKRKNLLKNEEATKREKDAEDWLGQEEVEQENGANETNCTTLPAEHSASRRNAPHSPGAGRKIMS